MSAKTLNRRREKQRRKTLAASVMETIGMERGYAGVSPKEAAFRYLHEKGFDIEKAIASLRRNSETRLRQIQQSYETGNPAIINHPAILRERTTLALEREAVQILERLKKLPREKWISRARALYNRDLIKSGGSQFSPREEAAALLTLSATLKGGDLQDAIRKARLTAKIENSPNIVQRQLRDAIQVSAVLVASSKRRISEARSLGANARAIAMLESSLAKAEAISKVLTDIDRKSPEQKIAAIRALLKEFQN